MKYYAINTTTFKLRFSVLDEIPPTLVLAFNKAVRIEEVNQGPITAKQFWYLVEQLLFCHYSSGIGQIR